MPIPGIRPGAIKAAQKPTAPARGYGVLAPPKSSPFNQPLRAATKQNIETGGRLRQYAQEHPQPVHRSFLDSVGHTISDVGRAGLHEIEHLAQQRSTGAELQRAGAGKNENRLPTSSEGIALRALTGGVNPVKTFENIPGSAQRLALGAPTMVSGTADALVGLAQGKPQLAEHMAGGLVKQLSNPSKFIEEEPVTAAAMLLGPKALVGKALTPIAKTGAFGEAVQSLADYTRPAVKAYNGIEVPAQASDDLLTKGTWRAKDAFSARILRQDPLATSASKIQRYIYGGGVIGHAVAKATGKKVAGWVKPGLADIIHGRGETLARSYASMFKRAIHVGERQFKPRETDAIVPIMEHSIHSEATAGPDIAHRIGELKDEGKDLVAGSKKAQENADQIQQYEGLADHVAKGGSLSREFAHAEHLTNLQDQVNRELINAHVLEPNQLHAALVPYARSEMNARLNMDPGSHPVTNDEGRAETAVRKAKANVQKAAGERKATAEAIQQRAYLGEHQPLSPRQGAKNISEIGAHTLPQVEKVHGDPMAMVTIYRAVPDGKAIQAGNWVTLEKPNHALTPGATVISKEVPAGSVFADMTKGQSGGLNPNSFGQHEFSYQPHEHALQTAKDNVVNSENFLHRVKNEKNRLIETGGIKPNGDAWPRIEDTQGNPLTSDQILTHMHEHYGDRSPGFITHKNHNPVETAARVTNTGERGIGIKPRTGESYGNGTYSIRYSDLIKQFELHARLLAEHQTEDQMHNTFTFGYFGSGDEAKNWIAAHPELESHLGPLKVVSRGSDKLGSNRIFGDSGQKVLEQFGVHENRTVQEAGPGARFGIQPAAAADRIAEHDVVSGKHGGVAEIARGATSLWRKAALYTSTHWPVGVGQENLIRTAMYGMSPMGYVPFLRSLSPAYRVGEATARAAGELGGKVVDMSGDPQRAAMADPTVPLHVKIAARQHAAAIDAGNFFGSMAAQMEPDLKDLLPHEQSAYEAFARATGPAQAIKGWHAWEKGVGRLVTHFEVSARKMVEGKIALNEVTKFGSDWRALVKGEKDIVHKWVENKLPPSEAAAHAQKVMDAVGNWSNLTPALRSMRALASPFGLWAINSLKFLFKTLPVDHPMKTATLAALSAATGANKKAGAELASGKEEYSVGNFPLNLPIAGEVNGNVLHYTPLDTLREPGVKLKEMFLPQINALTEELDPKYPSGASTATKFIRGGENVGEQMVPFARPLAEILRGGGKPNPKSINPLATKPGTSHGLAAEAMKYGFPLPTTFAKAKAKTAKGVEKAGKAEGAGAVERAGPVEKVGKAER